MGRVADMERGGGCGIFFKMGDGGGEGGGGGRCTNLEREWYYRLYQL